MEKRFRRKQAFDGFGLRPDDEPILFDEGLMRQSELPLHFNEVLELGPI